MNALYNELDKIYKIQQKNLKVFVGAFFQNNQVGILTHYYIKDSLYEMLINDKNNIKDIILISIINDLINGLDFLHRSEIKYHGKLTSKCCFVDCRWVLKIKDFGLHSLNDEDLSLVKCSTVSEDCRICPKLLWNSPESLLRNLKTVSEHQKSDVFSFGVIIQECFTNQGPWKSRVSNKCYIIRQLKS